MIPLALHSGYSFLQGTSGVEALVGHAAALGHDRLALTDTDNLCGLWAFMAACRRHGIRPITGAEITEPATSRRAVCLVKDIRGYAGLCRLLSRRHTSSDFDLASGLAAFGKGLVVLVSDPNLLYAGHEANLDMVAAMFGHPLPADHLLCRAAQRLDIPLAAAPAVFFSRPEDFEIHRVLRAIAGNTIRCRLTPRDTARKDAFLAAPRQYMRRFAACPQAVLQNAAIAERIGFTGPDFGLVMPPYESALPEQAAGQLRRAAYEGARRRYGQLSTAVTRRLDHELDIISAMGFCGYFLIVADIVRQSPRTCGRGSGAASLVAYCLGITNVCPVKHNLYFERFLNPGRKDPPDLDVDFAWDERDAVISGVLEKYAGRAALVCNHVCFGDRMAIRETARVLGMTEREISRGMKAEDPPPPWPEIFRIAARIAGLPRNLSVHPGGVVITPKAIDTYAPVQTTARGLPVLQWDKDGVEDAGLVKIDLLGNRSLGVIRDALAGVCENGAEIDENAWVPEEDPATRQMVAQGRTMGCFYIESPAMRLLQEKSRTGDFSHLVIHSSIIRPAANEVIQEYLRRIRGGAWKPIHHLAADVLTDTYGLMVYQEDVSRVAVCVAGFSHAEADGLRKVMSKKDRSRHLGDYYQRFAAGAQQRGVASGDMEAIWRMIMSFGGYSFCKPHSASYARVSFQAAYLKTHFPAEFMAAVISNQGGFYSAFAYVSEARRLGLTVLGPDVEESRIAWTGKGRKLRVGLVSVKGLSFAACRRIVCEQGRGAFAGARDFFDRVGPDETEARALIHCGALDRFHPEKNRAVLLWQFCARARAKRPGAESAGLFSAPSAAAMPDLPEADALLRLRREFAVLGFLCHCHPMSLFAHALKGANTIKAADIPASAGRRVRFAGWRITGKTVLSKKGDPMEFVTFEDETGLVETTFFPDAFDRFAGVLESGRAFLLSGVVEKNWGAATLRVDGLQKLGAATGRMAS